MKNLILKTFIALFSLTILFMGVRGIWGNPTPEELNTDYWKDDGPLELSPERGRYALMYSLVEDNSFEFSLPVARLATPDLGYLDGKYVSLFAPAVSFIAIPGYIAGKFLGISQVGAFLVISIFAVLNVLLIIAISEQLGAKKIAGVLAALVFLFATPAFAYSVSLYQHQISTFSVLAGIWLLVKYNNWLSLFLIWFLCALSIPIDYPNLFFMLPIGIVALGKLIKLEKDKTKYRISINLKLATSFIGIVFPLAFFMWFNYNSYGHPLQFSGTVVSVEDISPDGTPRLPDNIDPENPDNSEKSSVGFFWTRDLVPLGYLHLFSPDRGALVFAPVMFLGILGIIALYRQRGKITALLLAIVGFNIILYTMFGEGGWAFGSRYLIPTYSVMAIFLAIALTQYSKQKLFLFLFLLLSTYSVAVNTVGAITTSRIPPKVEAEGLERITNRKEHYTYLRSWEFLDAGKSKSFVYKTWAYNYVTPMEYFYIMAGSIIAVLAIFTVSLGLQKNEK